MSFCSVITSEVVLGNGMNYTPPSSRPGGLRLHLNENTAGCSPAVLAALQSMQRTYASEYPDYAWLTEQCERYQSRSRIRAAHERSG